VNCSVVDFFHFKFARDLMGRYREESKYKVIIVQDFVK